MHSLAPYNEWVPQMMGQGATPGQAKWEVRLGLDLEEVLEGGAGGEGDGGEEGDSDDDEGEGVERPGEEEAGAHPSGGAAGSTPTPSISQEVQQALTHSNQVFLGKTPSVHSQLPPHLPAAPRVSDTPRVPTALEKW